MRRKREDLPSGKQTVVTWGLAVLWLLIMSLGVVCWVNPQWLKELSRPGIKVETREYRDFGDDALRQGNYPRAIAQYRRALATNPNDVGATVNLGIAYSQAGDAASAVRLLKDALQLPIQRKGVIYYNLGELLEAQGKPGEAARYYQQAVGFDVEQDVVYRKLGSLYLAAERYEDARVAFEMSLASQLDIGLQYKYMLRRKMDLFEDDPTKVKIIEEELAREIGHEDLTRYDLKIIRRTQQSDPEIAKTHNYLGLINGRLGDIGKAIEHFRESLRIWPDNRDAKRNLRLLEQLREKQD